MNYYLVKCKFGHVGRDKYLPLIVAIKAESVKEASKKAKNVGGVKRDHKDWCLEVPHEVSYEEYETARIEFKNDIYFEKHSRSRTYLFEGRLKKELNYSRINGKKSNNKNYFKIRDREIVKFKCKREKVFIKSLVKYQLSEMV